MLQEENGFYVPYRLLPQLSLSSSAGILDEHPVTQAPSEQDASQPPSYPSGLPPTPTPPHKRRAEIRYKLSKRPPLQR